MLTHVFVDVLYKSKYHTARKKEEAIAKTRCALGVLMNAKQTRGIDWDKVEASFVSTFGFDASFLWELGVEEVNACVLTSCGFNPGFFTTGEALERFKVRCEHVKAVMHRRALLT